MGILDSIKGLLTGNKDKADAAIDKTADVIDDKTGGKATEQIDKGADAAKDAVDKITE